MFFLLYGMIMYIFILRHIVYTAPIVGLITAVYFLVGLGTGMIICNEPKGHK